MHAGKPTPAVNRTTHRCKTLPCPPKKLLFNDILTLFHSRFGIQRESFPSVSDPIDPATCRLRSAAIWAHQVQSPVSKKLFFVKRIFFIPGSASLLCPTRSMPPPVDWNLRGLGSVLCRPRCDRNLGIP